MTDSSRVSQQLAVALLDAWCNRDAEQIREFADHFRARDTHFSDPGEAERLDLIGCIAVEMYRVRKSGKNDPLEPFVSLLLHLAEPAEVRGDFSCVD